MPVVIVSLKRVMNEYVNREWFLPAIQRPYVWGNRSESELFVCKLFDSLYRKYPIGAFIIWKTEQEVAHRQFLRDYHCGDIYKNVDSGLYGRKKSLIYDGQQRLQTLFSCLKYSYNNKQLVFDLAYDPSHDNDVETGFRFVSPDQDLKETEIKLNKLFATTATSENKIRIRNEYENRVSDSASKIRIDDNLEKLWNVFVSEDYQPIVYFEVPSEDEEEVNEVFARLNTAGIPLSKADLLFSRIKADYPEFEAEIMQFSKDLQHRRKISFTSYDILQLIHLIVLGRSRVDDKVNKEQIKKFKFVWDNLKKPLDSFFDNYLYGEFRITHMPLIRNKNPLLVLAVFFYKFYVEGKNFEKMSKELLRKLNYFFIVSEINDWTLQSYTDNFCKFIRDERDVDFPLDNIIKYVNDRKNREIELREEVFVQHCLFALKVLIKDKEFQYDPDASGRYNPELDHIFPVHLRLEKEDENYIRNVDTIWNLQPVKGDINNSKSNYHPKDYFSDACVNGKKLAGSKYLSKYDFLPPMANPVWDNYLQFIDYRKKEMIKKLKDEYGICLKMQSDS